MSEPHPRVRIQPATSDQLQRITELAFRTMRACYGPFLGLDAIESYIETGLTAKYLAEELPNAVCLTEADRLVGIGVRKGHLLDLLMIDPDAQRRGFGTRLALELESRIFLEHDTAELESFEENDNANAFYRAADWEEVERFTDPESGYRKIRFRKRRSPPEH